MGILSGHSLEEFWQALGSIGEVSFEASSVLESGGWNGHGEGTVSTDFVDDNTLCTRENGFWNYRPGKRLEFFNIYRWKQDQHKNIVTLEHLRHGEHRPVMLFDLVCDQPGSLHAVAPFDCNKDQYLASMVFTKQTITMHWKIYGPHKNERITCNYS